MALIIKYDDIESLLSASSSQFLGWNENIGDVKNILEAFVNMESFSGMTATSLKSYIGDVNQTVVKCLQEIFADFETRFLLYREGFFTDVDDDLHTIITEDEMKTCKTSIEQGHGDFLDTLELINTQVNRISDLVSGMPNASAIKKGYSSSSKSITTILQDAEAHEDYHLQRDFSHIESLISSLTAFCNEMLAQTNKEMKSYQPGTIYGYASHQALTADYASSGAERGKLVLPAMKASENERIRQGLLVNEALAQGRTEQGWVSFVSGSLMVIGGVACIVFSAGLATPWVVALGVTSGIATTSYAVSNMVQAGYDIYLGQAGDATTVAFNPLRDTVFWGNQTAYDIFGFTAVTSSMVFTAGVSAYNIYQVGGAQAAQVFVGKTIISAGNGYIGGLAGQQTALYFGASPAQAQLAGLASGAFFAGATAISLNKIDTYYNWSGTNPVYTQSKPTPEGYKVPAEMQRILDKYNMTIEEFNSVNSRPYRTQTEINMLKEIRTQVPALTSDTTLRKVIPVDYVDGMIDDPQYSKPSGYMTTKDSVSNISKTSDVINSSRLDYKYGPYKANGDYAYIDFTTDDVGSMNIPYSKEFGGTTMQDGPFAGSGFTAGQNGTIVPEWTSGKVTPSTGSTMHQVIGGTDKIVAVWNADVKGWVRIN